MAYQAYQGCGRENKCTGADRGLNRLPWQARAFAKVLCGSGGGGDQ